MIPDIETLQLKTMIYGMLAMLFWGISISLIVIAYVTGILKHYWRNR